MEYTSKEKGDAYRKNSHLKQRAARKGIDFNISMEEMLKFRSTTHCQLTGLTLVIQPSEKKKILYNSLTIDRIDSSKGYVTDNIMVICHYANAMKARLECPNNPTVKKKKINTIEKLLDFVKQKATDELVKQNIYRCN